MSFEKDGITNNEEEVETGGQTARNLKARHIQMIAIGGTIGTGLFLNSAAVIQQAGAVGALIAYMIAGLAIFFVVSSLGEMATLIPVSGSFATYASRFVDPALGFTVGWNYCLLWFIVLPIELMSTASFLGYWIDVSKYLLMAIILVVLVAINCFAVKGFGEIEYWLALIKIIAILFFIVVSTYVVIKTSPGTSNYDAAGGPFLGAAGGEAIKNTIEAMIGACFAFGGTELIGITAGEAKNPRHSVPRAINGTFWRIIVFYISSILLIGLLLPANLPEFQNGDDLMKSPYVIALQKAQIPGVNHFMNFICFAAVLSAANSAIYASSRSLMGLALQGHAPKFLGKTTGSGVPIYAVAVTVCFSSISFLGSLVGDGVVFEWLVKLVGLSIIVIWLLITITHLRFRKAYIAQGYKICDLPYKALFFPYGCYFGLFVCLCIIVLSPAFGTLRAITEGESPVVAFLSTFITIPIFVCLFVFWKVVKKTSMVPLLKVDFKSGNSNLCLLADSETESRKDPSKLRQILTRMKK